jgi:hypothetical protein
MSNMEQFNINYQWKLYLERVGLKEGDLTPVQRIEMKRTFFGAAGQIMLLFDDLTDLNHDKAENTLMAMIKEIEQFWKEQK